MNGKTLTIVSAIWLILTMTVRFTRWESVLWTDGAGSVLAAFGSLLAHWQRSAEYAIPVLIIGIALWLSQRNYKPK